jgi:hypothetical protein
MIKRAYRVAAFTAVAIVMLACIAPALAPVSAPIPTFDPNSPLTAIVETANAAATQTALVISSTPAITDTPLPTITPTETITPTFIFLIPTWTAPPTPITPGSSGLEYQCQVVSQEPPDDTVAAPGALFDAIWRVTNVGKNAWFSTDIDYRYYSGSILHRKEGYDLETSVAPGGSVDITAAMRAPTTPGTYTTQWRIYLGRQTFCPMNLTIIIN